MGTNNTAYNVLYANKGKSMLSIYAVGNLVRDIPFLVKKKNGDYVTPFFLRSKDGKLGMVTKNKSAYALCGGKMKIIDVPIIPKGGFLTMPTLAIDLRNKTYTAVSEFISEVNARRNGIDETTVFLPFLAFGDLAYNCHAYFHQGDLLSMYGNLIQTNTGIKQIPVLWANDIRLIKLKQQKAADVE